MGWGLCSYVIVHTKLPPSRVVLWIELVGKPKWLPLKFGYHDVLRTSPIKDCVRAKQISGLPFKHLARSPLTGELLSAKNYMKITFLYLDKV